MFEKISVLKFLGRCAKCQQQKERDKTCHPLYFARKPRRDQCKGPKAPASKAHHQTADYAEVRILLLTTARRPVARPWMPSPASTISAPSWSPTPRPPRPRPLADSRIPGDMNSQARSAASSKSGAAAGRTYQPVTSFPNTRMNLIFRLF